MKVEPVEHIEHLKHVETLEPFGPVEPGEPVELPISQLYTKAQGNMLFEINFVKTQMVSWRNEE